MMRTEKQLWKSIDREQGTTATRYLGEKFTRIETGTALGVSDVEYVTHDWHGWIELKVSLTVGETSRITFGSEFTAEQWNWLTLHHRPKQNLRSWLLIGFGGTARWRSLLLVAPMSAIPFLSLSEAPSLQAIQRRPGVYRARTLAEALDRIRGV
jgi:hypothetical protein